ncbi:hypothetical protein CAPTEDRAFT_133841 [Capitella teleta]|uniref:BACK domain-containing protein n=1 Tax=Capitella teleta TaxID=283909 RepID=R7U9T4_CAPTE|nr:hypothetical protein CAPTEDRAFT_133841 [Capitella teleta]|eukprot:ELT99870.1 hypothetical protein CAPTEDRAFT_133841 [Capitella teleta]
MITARYYHSSVYHNGHIYVVGGRFSETSYTAAVEALNMKTQEWRELPSLPVALTDCFTVSVSNNLYIVGGVEHPSIYTTSVYQYDALQSSWRPCTPMPEASPEGSCTSFHDKLFVVGGISKSCMLYEPIVDSWTLLQRPQKEILWGVSLDWNDRIILLGGQDNDSIEEYCPQSNQWSTWHQKLPKPGTLCFAINMHQY